MSERGVSGAQSVVWEDYVIENIDPWARNDAPLKIHSTWRDFSLAPVHCSIYKQNIKINKKV